MKYTICENHTTVHGLLIQTLCTALKAAMLWDAHAPPYGAATTLFLPLFGRKCGAYFIPFLKPFLFAAHLNPFDFASLMFLHRSGRKGWHATRSPILCGFLVRNVFTKSFMMWKSNRKLKLSAHDSCKVSAHYREGPTTGPITSPVSTRGILRRSFNNSISLSFTPETICTVN